MSIQLADTDAASDDRLARALTKALVTHETYPTIGLDMETTAPDLCEYHVNHNVEWPDCRTSEHHCDSGQNCKPIDCDHCIAGMIGVSAVDERNVLEDQSLRGPESDDD